jgi:hypothetical protein
MPTKDGNVLIAFLALFVSWTGGNLWSIICFGIHQLRSTPKKRDGLHHQIQALFNTHLSSVSLGWRLWQVSWHWRNRTTRIMRRTMPLISGCLAFFAVITAAGLFSSRVANVGDAALLRANQTCGWYASGLLDNVQPPGLLNEDGINSLDSLVVWSRTLVANAKAFSRICYPRIDAFKPDVSSLACSSTVVPFLRSTTNLSAACPFASEACEGPAASFDSGLIDSSMHLGINAPKQDRVQIRRVMTCVPVPIEKRYSGDWFETAENPSLQFKPYYIGPTINSSSDTLVPNATFVISNETLAVSNPYDP